MDLLFIFIPITTLILAFLLRHHFGVRGELWSWIEVGWSVLSIIALCSAFLQVNDKLNEIELAKVDARLENMTTALRDSTRFMLESLENRDVAASVQHQYKIQVPDRDDLGFELRFLAYPKQPTAAQLAGFERRSSLLCGRMFGSDWKGQATKLWNEIAAAGADNVGSVVSLYHSLVGHCASAVSISDLAVEELSLTAKRERRDYVYSFGWVWAYALGLGLGLKLLKAISDLLVEKRAKARAQLGVP